MRDAGRRVLEAENHIVWVVGAPPKDAGLKIEITIDTPELPEAMIIYGLRVLALLGFIGLFGSI